MIRRYRHKLRGTTFTVIGNALTEDSTSRILTEGAPAIVYMDEADRLYVRHADEFFDGRFEDITPARLWWPSAYMDEIIPQGEFTPDDWILCGSKEEGCALLAPRDRQEARDYGCITVADGEDAGFSWREPRGRAQMLIYPDATWHVEGGAPEDWTHVHDEDDLLCMDETLDGFARSYCDMIPFRGGDEPHGITVMFMKWGEARFRMAIAGRAARFVPLQDEAPAKAGGGNG